MPSTDEVVATATAVDMSLTSVIATGCLTVLLLSALFVVRRESQKRKENSDINNGDSKRKSQLDASKYPGGEINIFFATQTGTAEAFAHELEREGVNHGFLVRIVDMEDVAEIPDLLTTSHGDDNNDDDTDKNNNNKPPSRAIILAATYGEGEPTDNSTSLVQLCKEQAADIADQQGDDEMKLLKNLEYCVFGLGNRQYEHFNAMGIFFDDVLEKLGGTRVFELGVGDDDNDLEGDFESWKENMWTTLKERYCPTLDTSPEADTNGTDGPIELPECEYIIEYHRNGTTASAQERKSNIENVPAEEIHGSGRPYFTAVDCPVTTIRELRTVNNGAKREEVGSTVHLEIDISGNGVDGDDNTNKSLLQYQTADNLGVLPLNEPKVVESVAESLGVVDDLDTYFTLTKRDGENGSNKTTPINIFPMPVTIRECLTRYLDLTSAPRRADLKLLMQYAQDPIDRKALLRLSSKDGKAEYKEKILQGYVGMVDLLKLCPSLKIPFEHFVSVCHFLLPRFYTISSSSSVHPKSIHITVSVTQEERMNNKSNVDDPIFYGVCSNHLAMLRPNKSTSSSSSSSISSSMVRAFVRPSTFRLPKDPSTPIIMIGPGTGIAPMRALLQERQYQRQQQEVSVGSNILYFGCKKSNVDYLYQDELKSFQDDGTLNELYVAFSRENGNKKKVYVQHILKENNEKTWKLMNEQNAYIYVCGGVKMGQDVLETLKEIIMTNYDKNSSSSKSSSSSPEEYAKQYLADMSNHGRFVQELWA